MVVVDVEGGNSMKERCLLSKLGDEASVEGRDRGTGF